MKYIISSVRLVFVTWLITVAGYTAVVLGIAKAIFPQMAEGSMLTNGEGKLIGSRLIGQKFTQPRYFWPRPSAVDFNASAAGGSNKSPTSSDLTERASKTIAQYEASPDKPLPADLVAASGGGLDPHITERGAMYQAPRISQARGLAASDIETLIRNHAFSPGRVFTGDRLVNVLELNLALDKGEK